jgi:hypothetical protein
VNEEHRIGMRIGIEKSVVFVELSVGEEIKVVE